MYSIFKDRLNIEVSIEGQIKSDTRVELEAMLFDSNHILLASYCPGHVNGYYKMYKAGKFAIHKTIRLPENITKAEYFLEILLTDPNVAYLISLKIR